MHIALRDVTFFEGVGPTLAFGKAVEPAVEPSKAPHCTPAPARYLNSPAHCESPTSRPATRKEPQQGTSQWVAPAHLPVGSVTTFVLPQKHSTRHAAPDWTDYDPRTESAHSSARMSQSLRIWSSWSVEGISSPILQKLRAPPKTPYSSSPGCDRKASPYWERSLPLLPVGT